MLGACFFGLGAIFFLIGLVQMFAPGSNGAAGTATPTQPAAPRVSAARPSNFVPQQNRPATGETMNSPLSNLAIGRPVRVRHPVMGEMTLHVMGKVIFDELWQTTRGPQSPWVPTGNSFNGFWLENNLFLLNWQARYYLLDEMVPVTDADIQRDFATHARKFAQSDQSAEVLFSYPPTMWRMEDIGKFRVSMVEGEGLRMRTGATGRFIHARGSAQQEGVTRGLVLEDYEGGGQDTVWTGYIIQETEIQA